MHVPSGQNHSRELKLKVNSHACKCICPWMYAYVLLQMCVTKERFSLALSSRVMNTMNKLHLLNCSFSEFICYITQPKGMSIFEVNCLKILQSYIECKNYFGRIR